MSKRAFFTVLVVLLIASCGGGKKPKFTKEELAKMPFPQRSGLPEASGGLVLAVGGEIITSDEIVKPLAEHFRPIARENNFEQFEKQARPQLEQILVSRVSNILLYNQAKRDTGVDEEALEKAAEREVRRFISSFGGDYAKAEEALKKMGMDWASFKEYQKRLILTEYYLGSLLPRAAPITYSELLARYNQIKDESFVILAAIKFQLIDIEPAKLRKTDPNQDQLEQARNLANELLQQVKSNKDFFEQVKEYSGVSFPEYSEPVQPESLKYSILADEAEKLEPGDISETIETIDENQQKHIFIMKLVEKHPKGYEPLEKVQREVRTIILSGRRKEAQEKILTRLRRQAEHEMSDEFTEFCLQNIYAKNNK